MWNFEFCDINKERVKVLIPIKSSLIFYFNIKVKINLLATTKHTTDSTFVCWLVKM